MAEPSLVVVVAAAAAAPAPVVPPPPLLPRIDHAGLRTTIQQQARTIDDFERIYNSVPFQLCLRSMLVARGNDDVDSWAREWALRMRNNRPAHDDNNNNNDLLLSQCRRTALLLVSTLLDIWRQGQQQQPPPPANEDTTAMMITTCDLTERFQRHRFWNILSLVVPLDQAECLYSMRYVSTAAYGMHWVAAQHVDRSRQWQQILAQVNGQPTMDHRYIWLMEDPALQLGLQLHTNADLIRWLDPYRNHLVEEDLEEVLEEAEETEEDMDMQED